MRNPMDKIAFEIETTNLQEYLTTKIFINGYDLRERVAQIEFEELYRKIGQRPLQTPAYEGLPPFIAFHLNNHFCGDTINEYRYPGGRLALLEYVFSGVPGDHTLTCRIDLEPDRVIWTDFKLFSKVIPMEPVYDRLRFEFDRNQYMAEVEDLKITRLNPIYT